MARFMIAAFALGLTVLVAALLFYRPSPTTLTMNFQPLVGGKPLVRNQFIYSNPGGDGTFRIRDFQFFISNVGLVGAEVTYNEKNSYHLARFDNATGSYEITLTEVPRGRYESLRFTLGLDSMANRSLAAVGDLDPNGRMAWNWETGYKFVLFEGMLETKNRRIPLVYHVGFDENARTFAFDISGAKVGARPRAQLNFSVVVDALFGGAERIDLVSLSNVKFDRGDASRLAANYATMIRFAGHD